MSESAYMTSRDKKRKSTIDLKISKRKSTVKRSQKRVDRQKEASNRSINVSLPIVKFKNLRSMTSQLSRKLTLNTSKSRLIEDTIELDKIKESVKKTEENTDGY